MKENIFYIVFLKYLHQDRARWALNIFIVLLLLCPLISTLGAITGLVRLIYPVTIIWGFYTAGLYLLRLISAHYAWRYPVIAILLAIICWVSFAGRPYDIASLRNMYRSRLISFSGTFYVWGGESHLGIDCSGLARTALIEAMIFEGLRTGNPRLIGPQVWDFWWHDMSAKAMGEGTYGYTNEVCRLPKLAGADTSKLQIGDLAVTESGVHVLIYLGDNRWIEANPEDQHVVTNEATATSNRIYFNQTFKIMRWKWLL
jgi:hypothetical protein